MLEQSFNHGFLPVASRDLAKVIQVLTKQIDVGKESLGPFFQLLITERVSQSLPHQTDILGVLSAGS